MSDGDDGSGGGAADILLGGAGGGGAVTPPVVDGVVTPPVVDGAADPEWYGNLSADPGDNAAASNRDYVKAKGFKDLDGLTGAYRSLEQRFHDTGMVKIPGEGATPEETATFRKAIGVPDTVEGYKFEGPKDEAGTPLPLADGLIAAVLQSALDNGLPADPVKAMLADVIAADLDAQRTALSDAQTEAQAWIKDQGAAGAAKLAAINTAARVIGLSNDEVLAARSFWGAKRSMEIFAKLGDGLSEDVMLSGGKQRFGVTGAEAKAQLASRMATEGWSAKALTKGSPENAEYVRLRDASAAYEGAMAGEA